MGIIDASLTRNVTHMSPTELFTADMITWETMCDMVADEEQIEEARSVKLAEIDSIMANLQSDLDSTPSSRWNHISTVYRLELLVIYSAKRTALKA